MGCAIADGDRSACNAESRAWLTELRGEPRTREDALRRLHELLLRMAYASLVPRGRRLPAAAVDELALEAADQATVSVLAHLDDFRGASRFTTWACQFAVTEVSASLRRYRRQRRDVPVEPERIVLLGGTASDVEHELEQKELLRSVCAAFNDALTPRQRRVLLALAVDGESPRTLAASLRTSEGALYKTVHDARRKLRKWTAGSKNGEAGDSNAAEAMGAAT